MDTIEQNTQERQTCKERAGECAKCETLAASFSVQALSAGQRSGWGGAGGADHWLSSGAGDEEGLEL